MPVGTWPTELPEHLEREGFSEDFADTRIFSDVDIGPKIVRRRSTAGVGKMKGTLILTKEQLIVFKDFYQTELAGGVYPFLWTNPADLDEERLYRFGSEPPQYTVLGYNTFRLSLELEILP